MGHQQPHHQWEERPGELDFVAINAEIMSMFQIMCFYEMYFFTMVSIYL